MNKVNQTIGSVGIENNLGRRTAKQTDEQMGLFPLTY